MFYYDILKYKKKKKEKLDNSQIVSRFQKLRTYSKGHFYIDEEYWLIEANKKRGKFKRFLMYI